MSNNPILPIVVSGEIARDGNLDGENLLATNNANLDEDETTDDRETVDEDVREADSVNENLDK